MFRTAIFIPMLVASLLACPLKCMGTMHAQMPPSADPGCGCCHSSCVDLADVDPASSEPRPDMPSDDCTCPSCVCNGAVLGADKAAVDLEPLCQFFSLSPAAAHRAAVLPAAGDELSALLATAAAPGASGRSVRIAHQSFLL